MSSPPSQPYLPEIDGLRTIAVASVFLHHLWPAALPGGFVGVDIFFVLSGFLITRQLAALADQGHLSLAAFYQRRIARIAPAALLVILAVILAALLLYSTQDAVLAGSHGIASALAGVNVLLIRAGSYFDMSAEARPLAHYWSLAVEEQFYLLYPLLLWFLMRRTARPLVWLSLAAGLSFLLCAVLTFAAQPYAFYLLPFRAWQLLAGGMLAFGRTGIGAFAPARERAMAAAGVTLALMSVLLVRPTAYPGFQSLLPVAAAMLVIAGAGQHSGPAGRWLASPSLRWIGRRSYLLYLWHWPVFSFVGYTLFDQPIWLSTGLKLVLTLLLTEASHRLVETPARRWLNAPHRQRAAFTLLLIGVLITCAAGQTLRNRRPQPSTDRIADGGLVINPEGRRWLVVMGDSTALILQPELRRRARQLDVRINFLARSEVNQLPGEWRSQWSKVDRFLDSRRPDAILLVQAWSFKASALGPEAFPQAVRVVASRTDHLILIGEAPAPIAPALNRQLIADGRAPVAARDPYLDGYRLRSQRQVEALDLANTRFVPIDDLFTLPDGTIDVRKPGALLYYDPRHLSDEGLKRVYPRLFGALEQALAK